MARIRSIKPEFSTNGDMLRLSDSCALFFILLWNYCDDEGKHEVDLNQIVAELGGRWKQDKVKLFISCLVNSGQLRVSSEMAWVQVTGWSHQKIDKPKQPKIKAEEIHWLDQYESEILLEQYWKPQRKDRIGSDRKGSDRIVAEKSQIVEIVKPKKPSADSATAEVGKQAHEVIARYCELWKAKYKTQISFSGKWAGNAKTLVKDHGLKRSLELVESFMEMNDKWFLDNRHSFDLILTKLASITHYSGTGVVVTQTQLNQLDKSQANKSAGEAAAKYFLQGGKP